MITVTKCFDFCYGHHLPDYDGKCLNFHGHNSRVEIEVSLADGFEENPTDYPTMVMDFSKLKEIVKPILDNMDHQDLNAMFAYPTAETIVLFLSSELIKRLPKQITLQRVRVTETPDSWAEWRRKA